MTFATATLERFTETTTALTPITETPVVRDATAAEYRTNRDEFTFMLYCTRIDSYSRADSPVGTVIKVAPTSTQDGWLYRHTNGMLYRAHGAPLNPVMVNGHYYRALGGRNWLVQYHDEDHMGDRNVASMPLSTIAADGVPWPFPSDAIAMWDANEVPYIEVEAPAQPMDVPQFADADMLAITGPTRGLAQAEDDGRVMLDPALEVGGVYLYWTPRTVWDRGSMVEARLITAIEEGAPMFQYLGYWTVERVAGADVPYFYTSRRTVLDSAQPKHWVKLALTTTEPTNVNIAPWTTAKEAEVETFKEFNEATNELANDNDWCSDYDGIVEKLGMESRLSRTRDWDVEVSADFSFDVDSVSGRIDTEVANSYDIPGISLNSARFTGTARVTIRVSEQSSASDAADYIDSDEVYEALRSQMSGVDNIEVDDFSIRGTVEAD